MNKRQLDLGEVMKAEELARKYDMEDHIENGKFVECHYEEKNLDRAASGCIYYYVAKGERTEFHRIDCDEYWIYNAGNDIELWVVNLEGHLEIKYLGTGDNSSPAVRIAKGEIFASRLKEDSSDGCFVTCITVPRFTYEGFEIIEKEVMCERYPETLKFWE